MEKKEEKPRKNEEEEEEEAGQRHQPPYISGMEPVQREAYGGGLYGKEEGQPFAPSLTKTMKRNIHKCENSGMYLN